MCLDSEHGGLQDEAVSLLGTIINIISRLPALEDTRNYGTLAELPGVRRALLSKQLLSLERLMGQLRDSISSMQQSVAALSKLSCDAQRQVQQDRRLTPAARAAVAGPVPSIDQCLEGLQEIWWVLPRAGGGRSSLHEAAWVKLSLPLSCHLNSHLPFPQRGSPPLSRAGEAL